MDTVIVNWGASNALLVPYDYRVLLNKPGAISCCSSKLNTLRLLKEQKVPCLEFTVDPEEAKVWMAEGNSVVCRDLLRGHGGEGIRIIRFNDPAPDFGQAKLLTRYFRKKQEVRVHVAGNEILAVAEKRKRLGQPGDYWVRSHSRGWIFAEARDEFREAREVARRAVQCLGLDFGAVDVGVDRNGRSVVFEVNSAPALEGRTLEAYVNYFRGI